MAADVNIEHEGTVQRVEGCTVFVVVTSNSACGSCEARKACGLSESTEKIVEVETQDAAAYAAGDRVVVSVRRRAGMRAVAVAYALPLLLLLAVMATVKAAGGGDGAAAAAAIGSVAVYYLMLGVFRDKISNGIKFTIHKL